MVGGWGRGEEGREEVSKGGVEREETEKRERTDKSVATAERGRQLSGDSKIGCGVVSGSTLFTSV